jgi:hypothetical protein
MIDWSSVFSTNDPKYLFPRSNGLSTCKFPVFSYPLLEFLSEFFSAAPINLILRVSPTCTWYIIHRIAIGRLRRPLVLFYKFRHFLIKILLGHYTCARCGSILLKNVHVVVTRGTNFDRLGEVRRQGVSCNWRSLISFFRCRQSASLSFPSYAHPRKP